MQPKKTFNEDEVSLEIDLQKLFGRRVNDPSIRRSIAERAIEIILERTEEGKGVDGNKVVKLKSPYSKQYSESLEFQGFNKEKNKVNMKLTGSMLSSVDLIAEQSSKIKIGIDDPDEAPKAFNHLTGDTVPKRPWLGLTSADLDKIKSEYQEEVDGDTPVTAADLFDRQSLTKVINVVTKRKTNFEFEDT